MFAAGGRGKCVNHDLAIGRPVEPDRVQHIAFGRETKVFGCIARRVGIVKGSSRYFGWAFAIDPPWPSTIDGISIHIQPRADIEKNLLHFLRDGAIRSWTDVQQQIAILADDINELMDLLAPEVTLWTDGGGKVRQAMRPIIGAPNVARWLAGTIQRPYEGVEIADMTAEVVDINGAPGIVIRGADRIIATLTVDLDADGRIETIHNVANPDKLHAIADGVTRL